MLFVMLMTAALLALYGRLVRLPTLPAIDARFTITPRFCAIIVGSTAWVAKNTLLALMFIIASQCSSVTSSVAAAGYFPALFTRMSIRPNSARVCSTMA